jgi:intracellular multiplication protein IcmP
MDSLVEAEKVSWLQITPVAPLNLIETDIDKGPWAMSLSPMQFAKQHRLMKLERVLPSVSTATTATGGSYLVAHLQREAARRTFVVQLGSYWEGTQALPSHTQALLAVFAARAARDREASNQLLLQIAASAVGNKAEDGPAAFISRLNFSGTDTLLKKYLTHKTVAQVTKRHAYVLGVLASMLQLARQDGVLAAADFLWLKPADRPLWFMLNAVGRQTAFPEVAGPFAHWIAERSIGHKLVVPMVDTAVSALEIALKEVRLSEESLEGS